MSENPHDFTLKIVSIETKFNQTSQKNFRPLGICLINKKSTPMYIYIMSQKKCVPKNVHR